MHGTTNFNLAVVGVSGVAALWSLEPTGLHLMQGDPSRGRVRVGALPECITPGQHCT